MLAWGPFRRSRREESNQLDWLRALLKNDEGAEGVQISGKDLHQLPRYRLRFGAWGSASGPIVKILNKTSA